MFGFQSQGAPNYVVSSSSGANNGSSATYVTMASVSITTRGRPVELYLIDDGSANTSLLGSSDAAASSDVTFNFKRDITVISEQSLAITTSGTTVASKIPVGSMNHFDPVAAGTYTYAFEAKAISGFYTVNYVKLVAYEVGT